MFEALASGARDVTGADAPRYVYVYITQDNKKPHAIADMGLWLVAVELLRVTLGMYLDCLRL